MACCGRASRVAPASGGLVSEKEICLNAQGTIVGAASLRAQVAESEGLTAGARARLWQHLVGIAAWEASEAEIKAQTAERVIRFEELLHRAEAEGAVERQDVTVIDSDVPRTDRELPRWHDEAALAPLRAMLLAHCVHRAGGSTARGYYQGMNDLAAVMLDQALPRSPIRMHRVRRVAASRVQARTRAAASVTQVVTPQASPPPPQPPQPPPQQQQPWSRLGLQPPPPPPPTPPTRRQIASAFWLYEAFLEQSAANWAGDGFEGVWVQTRAVAQIVAAAAPRLARHLRRIDESRSPELADAQPLAFLFQAAACDALCSLYAACAAVLHARRTPHERAISCTRHCLRRRAMPHASWRGATPPPRCAREYRRNSPFAAPCSLPHRCSTPLLHTAAAHHPHRCCTPRAMPCARRRCCASSGRWRATSRRAACGRSAGRRAATSISRCSRGSCSRSRHGHVVHGSHNPIP